MTTNPNADVEIQALLADLWKKHLPSMRDRLNLLEQAASSAYGGSLGKEQCEEAMSVAHKLAGNLGMFGHNEAGAIASEIEQVYKNLSPETVVQLAALTRKLRQSLEPHLA